MNKKLRYSARAKKDQEYLKSLGYYRGKIDGLWGAKSIKAMAAYHENNRKPLPVGKKPKPPSKVMSRSQHQRAFTKDQCTLDQYLFEQGYEYTDGDAWSRPHHRELNGRRSHKRNSQHHKRLARDKNLYHNNKYMRKTSDHYMLGKFWEQLSPYNRSGCRYNDGNHTERLEYLWGNPFFDENSKYTRGLSKEELEALSPEEYFQL